MKMFQISEKKYYFHLARKQDESDFEMRSSQKKQLLNYFFPFYTSFYVHLHWKCCKHSQCLNSSKFLLNLSANKRAIRS